MPELKDLNRDEWEDAAVDVSFLYYIVTSNSWPFNGSSGIRMLTQTRRRKRSVSWLA